MQRLLKFIVLIVGGLLVLSGCASAEGSPPTSVESIPDATATQEPTTESQVEVIQPTVQSDEVVEEVQSQSEEVASSGYIFYDSYADW